MNALVSRLQSDLTAARAENKKSQKIGIAIVVIITLYLGWVTVQVNRMSDPEGLALAAAGAAVGATPVLGEHLRSVMVDGAPDIARLASSSVVDMIPAYREVAEAELLPLIDEVSGVLAMTATSHLAESMVTGETSGSEEEALQAGADAAVARLEVVLDEAMDEPTENDGPTPRQSIEGAISQLQLIDRGLKQVASKGGDPRERELILSWLSLIAEQTEVAETAAAESYRVEAQRAAEAAPAPEAAPAAEPPGTE
jgi:hypothetical protein